ncbi:MAG: DUF1553 domain-containing protein, partial [Planctomycetales bacterium]|nr:DUF1553 domain-containing protein [Planctomycetales bacterium]
SAPSVYEQQFKELKLGELRGQLDELAKTRSLVTRAPGMMRSPAHRETHIHHRGDFRRPGERVEPGTPSVLPPLPASEPSAGRPDRLALARWLVSPEHPLTARVTVNRLWQQLFGRGLVSTSDNLGVRGALPSHPHLLDWLATQFVRDGWSIKGTVRRIVLSDTYCQSSAARPELEDPANILLARQARLRLTGEAIRDSALAASGLLCRRVGGP